MKTNKAPGIDGIPAEVFKHGGTLLEENLLKLIQKCWEEQTLPQDFKDAVLIPIYKNKGDRRDCGNYRGISLLSVAGKILAKILHSILLVGIHQMLRFMFHSRPFESISSSNQVLQIRVYPRTVFL